MRVLKVTGPDLLTPAEVRAVFGVDAGTVKHWADEGKLTSIRTPGGHRRFSRAQVEALRDEHMVTRVTP